MTKMSKQIGRLVGKPIGRPVGSGVGGGGLDLSVEYEAVYNANIIKPTDYEAIGYNTFVTTIVAATGLWDKIGVLPMLATHVDGPDSLLDWKNPTGQASTLVSTLVWEKYKGYTPNGVDSYINTNKNPTDNSIKWGNGNCSLGAYSQTESEGIYVDIGSRNASNGKSFIISKYSGTSALGSCNDSSVATTNSSSIGLMLATLTGNTITLSRDGVSLGSTADSGSGQPTKDFYMGAYNIDGVAGNFSNRQLGFGIIGEYLTLSEALIITNAFKALQTYLGV